MKSAWLSLGWLHLLCSIVLETASKESLLQWTTEQLPQARMLQNVPETEHAFTVMFDFTSFDSSVEKAKSRKEDWATSETIDDQLTYVKENLEKVKKYVAEYFIVKFKEELKFSDTKCGGNRYQLAGKYLEKVDFYVEVILENNENSESPISAMNCLAEESTGRPVVGIMLINMLSTPSTRIKSRNLFKRYLHEFFHMLGYNSYVFQNFPNNENGQSFIVSQDLKGNSQDQLLKVSFFTENSVKQIAQDYFSCSSLEGLPLEYSTEYSAVSNHASFLRMPYSIMNGDAAIDPSIDKLTIAYLKSTGWYTIKDGASEADHWLGYDSTLSTSKNQCDIVNLACPASKNRCSAQRATSSSQRCSIDRLSKQTCEIHPSYGKPFDNFDCALWKNTQEYCREAASHSTWDASIEQISDSSLCFMAALQSVDQSALKPSCLKYACATNVTQNNALSVTLSLLNGLKVVCESSGFKVLSDTSDSFKKVSIECPNPADLCSTLNSQVTVTCGLDCTKDGLGICMAHGKCFCFFGVIENSSACASYSPEAETTSSSSNSSRSIHFEIGILIKLAIAISWGMT